MPGLKKLVVYALLSVIVALTLNTYFNIKGLPRKFEISGKIDECCGDAGLLKDVNSKIVDIVETLSGTLFFKIFKVNLSNDCPFWVQEKLCKSPQNLCKIKPENEKEGSLPWWQEKNSLLKPLQEDVLFHEWAPKKIIQWHAEEETGEQGIYVDLKKNQEAFTGFQGQHIWTAIYGENCFQGPLHDMCLEERLFNRIISGLHTSISTQLSEYYIDEKNRTYPNVTMFFEKVGNYPDRISNLYFAHSVLLRAINRAHEHIENYNYDTGNFREDLETRRLINELFEITLSNCDQPFDEKDLFANLTRNEVNIRFLSYFHNISVIMDCVACQKCRVYGKLQTLGIAAALKILFAEKFTGESVVHLKKNELIALMVTFYKFSTSLSYIDKMFERRYNRYMGIFTDVVLGLSVFITTAWILIKIYDERTKKVTNQIRTEFKNYREVDGGIGKIN